MEQDENSDNHSNNEDFWKQRFLKELKEKEEVKKSLQKAETERERIMMEINKENAMLASNIRSKLSAPIMHEPILSKDEKQLLIDGNFSRNHATINKEHTHSILAEDEQPDLASDIRNLFNFYSGIPEEGNEEEPVSLNQELKDCNWNYVICFPNPDFEGKAEHLEVSQARAIYNRMFRPDTRKMGQKEASKMENQVFSDILQSLDHVKVKSESIPVNKGGQMVLEDEKWNYRTQSVRDLLTLVRNICLYKLTKVLGINTCSFVSHNGDTIYVLLSVTEENLKFEADRVSFQLQYDVGSTDILSLEPVDELLYPLRFHTKKPEEIIELEYRLEDFFAYIYKEDSKILSRRGKSEPENPFSNRSKT